VIMNVSRVFSVLFFLCVDSVFLKAQDTLLFQQETLRYTVDWPSGLSLGEAEIHAQKNPAEQWDFLFTLEAAVPGFHVTDRFHSRTTADLCSVEFEKDSLHGKRTTRERDVIDRQSSMVTRETLTRGGGKSQMPVPACVKDALAFLYYVRSELGRGRIPPAQSILFGGKYDVQLEYGGRQNLRLADRIAEADLLTAIVKGQASQHKVEIFFSTDRTHKPVLVRFPLSIGTFSMQLTE